MRHPKQLWTEERRQLAVNLYAEHRSTKVVAELMHTSRHRVRDAMNALGAVRRKSGCPSMEENPQWKGGRIVDADGYILLKVAPRRKPGVPSAAEYPDANHLGYVREHRMVMEKKLGRPLAPGEVVHHLNGDKQDNRSENLELFASNGDHLAKELKGRTPHWTPNGVARLPASADRRRRRPLPSIPDLSESGAVESPQSDGRYRF